MGLQNNPIGFSKMGVLLENNPKTAMIRAALPESAQYFRHTGRQLSMDVAIFSNFFLFHE